VHRRKRGPSTFRRRNIAGYLHRTQCGQSPREGGKNPRVAVKIRSQWIQVDLPRRTESSGPWRSSVNNDQRRVRSAAPLIYMSFASLRAARVHKDRRSYANTASAAPPSSNEGSEKGSGRSQTVPLDGLYQSLPSSVEIRTSTRSGRGIWANASFNAGVYLSTDHD
jgi:hypothetical protein